MAAEKAPAYQWYPKDYESDEAVKLMTYEQEGIYRRLLDHQALHGGIPADVKQIAMLVPKVTLKRFLALWPALAGKFATVDGRMVNGKLERVKADTAAFRESKSESGKRGAASRWQTDGKHDGEPHGEVIAEPMANVSPATATASSSALMLARSIERRGTPPLSMNLQRVKIWRWMIDDMIDRLGDHADAFDLDAWILQVDRAENRVMPGGNWAGYWRTAFDAEVLRRGLPIAGGPVATLSKRSNGLLAAVANMSNTR